MAKKKKDTEEIKIKPRPKIKAPHKPTKVHKDRRQYSRKGKYLDGLMQEMLQEMDAGFREKTGKYSLWLMPEDHTYAWLYGLILKLSKKYATATFEPHITLIGELTGYEDEIIAITSQLATMINPCTITLTKIEYLDEFFRCLFIKAEETEEIMKGHEKARILFDIVSKDKYVPHLSLMYGNVHSEIKKAIITEIGRDLNVSFEVNAIHLFSTEGEPTDWYRVAKFTLK